ncbi:hypothetical protein GSI_13836 [Ganoderma sinense ZZ0214-1]|uniref:Pumilio homology domain family member 3 n=1 Tax=Ganoderma sinense ZZ0214-1 TaxID=1077348 RepID=A0A2G8RRD9_9APHY|nr:hypothetical protein GSI_13836 [Ganoderma sinense ZZ0214-1]
MFGVAMAPSNGLKTLSTGWQVWGGGNASRHPSSSSAASIPESSASHSLNDGWGSRSASWDEMTDAQQKDLTSLVRSRQVSAQSSGLPAGSSAPTMPAQMPTYNAVLGPMSSSVANYDSLQTSTQVDTELSAALRGMAVEDEYAHSQQSSYRQGSQPSSMAPPATSGIPARGPQQPPRGPYGGYPQTEYAPYYSGPSYSYDAYRTTPDLSHYGSSPALTSATATPNVYSGLGPQTLHTHAMTDLHAQQFYDYVNSSRTLGSQYYYPGQPLVYHAPPPHSPMLAPHPLAGGDKRRDQVMPPQNVLYANMRSSPSPHSSPYGAPLEYSPQLPRGMPYGGMHPHAGSSPQGYGGRHGRRGDGAVRSAQLDEFRANKSRKWELRDIFGYIVEFSGDQHGSRFIQQKLESATGEEMEIVFDEIVPQYAVQLMQDVFGNYVVQKMFEFGTAAQKARLVGTMEGQVLGLSLQMYGCRVVQKAIEYVNPEQQAMFVQELSANVLRCVKDANGNHVVQKVIEHVIPERLGFVSAFRGSVYELSTHPYGCRVLQRCFEYLPEEQTRPLLDELHKYVSNLMIDQFGNYVVQFVLEHGKPQDRAMIIAKLTGQMNNMAKHKFASNVCEKALVTADPDSRRQLIDEIMTPKQDGLSPIMGLMKDSFGNYVLQRALTVAEGEQKEQLISKVRPHLVNMRRYSSAYSKHLSAIERLLEKCAPTTPSGEATPVEVATETSA